ncbi:FAD-dependent oxidoreductase [Agrococcus baldri]|uniref:FAD-dependent oxidoreductase n=1 Tax=Agrococcus baldri TaxID=153730 RepID=A0AA87RGA6_9MICO|nr:FAD-dependent oxidoreductase [Agrococcus baldri]GEK80094.1 FAD-dependent oxidoreductase [Agrococcus baldri]
MSSLWQATGPTIGFDEAAPRRPDVLVVGAGITGLATAALLARRGATVVVLEAREVGAVATGNTTAKLSLLQGDRLHRILALAAPEAAQAFVDGSLEGQRRLLELLEERGEAAQLLPAVSYASGRAGAESLERELEAARSLGLPVETGGAESLPFPVAGAIRLEQQAQLQPMTVLSVLAQELRERGGRIMRGAVRSVRAARDGVTVVTDAGSWRAGTAVLATGAPVPARATATLLEAHRSYAAAYRVDAPLPRAMALSVDAPSRSLRTAEVDGETLLIAGGVGHSVGRHPDPRRLVAELDGWVQQHWPGAERTHVWSAQDYRTPDRLPWVGARAGSGGRVLLATGFDKWGMTGGVMSALALTGRIAGREPEWARTLRRRGTTPTAVGRLSGAFVATVGADLRGWREALAPAAAPPEGEGRLGRDGVRLVGTSTVDGQTRQVSAFCPHVGALVRWNPQERSWDCSAHGSRFAPDGTRLEGPAACALELRAGAIAGPRRDASAGARPGPRPPQG